MVIHHYLSREEFRSVLFQQSFPNIWELLLNWDWEHYRLFNALYTSCKRCCSVSTQVNTYWSHQCIRTAGVCHSSHMSGSGSVIKRCQLSHIHCDCRTIVSVCTCTYFHDRTKWKLFFTADDCRNSSAIWISIYVLSHQCHIPYTSRRLVNLLWWNLQWL